MKIHMLKSKLHQACVTDANIAYHGSIGIDSELMGLCGLMAYEKVLVANLENGNRFETYTIPDEPGARRIVINGAAAHLAKKGDRVIIMAFAEVKEDKVRAGKFKPRVFRLDENNHPTPVDLHDPAALLVEQ